MATEFICKCGAGAADYSTLAAWEADMDAGGPTDLVTANTVVVMPHSGKVGAIAAGQSCEGLTSGATGTILGVTESQICIIVATGTFDESAEVIEGSNPSRYVTTTGVEDTVILVAEIDNVTPSADTSNTTLTGITTSATNNIIIRAASGEEATMPYTAGKAEFDISSDQAINPNVDNIIIEKICFTITGAGSYRYVIKPNDSSNIHIRKCVFRTTGTSGESDRYIYALPDTGDVVYIYNNFVYGNDYANTNNRGINTYGQDTPSCIVYYNTLYDNYRGIVCSDSGKAVIKNNCCAGQGNADYIGTGHADSEYNGGITTPIGTSPVDLSPGSEDATDCFEAPGSGDLTLKSGSLAIEAGTPLHDDPDDYLDVTDDFFGTTRDTSSPCLGAHEYEAGGPAAIGGDIEVALAALEATITATRDRNADIEVSLAALKSAITASRSRKGDIEVSLGALKASITATRARKASIANSLAALTNVMTGTRGAAAGAIGGDIEVSLAALTNVITATRNRNADIANSLAALTAAITAKRSRKATINNALGALTVSMTGSIGTQIDGQIEQSLAALTAVITASRTRTAQIEVSLAPLTMVATATKTRTASIAASLGAMTASISGTMATTGTQLDRIENLLYILLATKT